MAANRRKNLLARIVTPGGDDPLLLRLVAPVAIRTGVAATGIALVGQGGAGGYAYSILTGSAYGGLPPGLTLNADGTITGTPTTPGNFAFVAQVQDADSSVYTASFSIRILSRMFRKHKQIRNGEVGLPYTFTLKVAGNTGAVTWSIVSGSLPAGLSLDSSTGVIDGTPTADSNGLGGISYFTARATDGGSGETLDLPDKILIYETPQVSFAADTIIYRGQFFSITATLEGGAPPVHIRVTGFPTSNVSWNSDTLTFSGVVDLAPGFYGGGIQVSDGLGYQGFTSLLFEVRDSQRSVQPRENGVDVGSGDPLAFNFEDGTNTTAEVTNVGGVVTVKFNSTGGGGGGSVASVGGALPDSSGDIAVTSPDGSVGIGVDSSGALTLTAEGGGIQSINGATPDSNGDLHIDGIEVDSAGIRIPRSPTANFSNNGIALTGTLTVEIPRMPYAGTITGWVIVGDVAGDADITVSHADYASFPTITTLFTASCSGVQKEEAFGLSHAFSAGDVLRFSATGFANFTRCSISLVIQ